MMFYSGSNYLLGSFVSYGQFCRRTVEKPARQTLQWVTGSVALVASFCN